MTDLLRFLPDTIIGRTKLLLPKALLLTLPLAKQTASCEGLTDNLGFTWLWETGIGCWMVRLDPVMSCSMGEALSFTITVKVFRLCVCVQGSHRRTFSLSEAERSSCMHILTALFPHWIWG